MRDTKHSKFAFDRRLASFEVEEGRTSNGSFVRAPFGVGESLVFRETQEPLVPFDGHHIQITVADSSGVHQRLLQRGLITEENNQSQHRFEDITDVDSGEVLATLERDSQHAAPLYARRFVNRDAGETGLDPVDFDRASY